MARGAIATAPVAADPVSEPETPENELELAESEVE